MCYQFLVMSTSGKEYHDVRTHFHRSSFLLSSSLSFSLRETHGFFVFPSAVSLIVNAMPVRGSVGVLLPAGAFFESCDSDPCAAPILRTLSGSLGAGGGPCQMEPLNGPLLKTDFRKISRNISAELQQIFQNSWEIGDRCTNIVNILEIRYNADGKW